MKKSVIYSMAVVPVLVVGLSICMAPQTHAASPLDPLLNALMPSTQPRPQQTQPAQSQTQPLQPVTQPVEQVAPNVPAAPVQASPAVTPQTASPQAVTPQTSAVQSQAAPSQLRTTNTTMNVRPSNTTSSPSLFTTNTPSGNGSTPSAYVARTNFLLSNPRLKNIGLIAASGSIALGGLLILVARTYRPFVSRRQRVTTPSVFATQLQ